MAEPLHNRRFPGESDAYRRARNELLQSELELRAQIEAVAARRRQLPPGGPVKEDYVFEELDGGDVRQVRLSELFDEGKPSLIIYSFMYGPQMPSPCPACTSLIDGFNGCAIQITPRVNFVVVAKSPTASDSRIRQKSRLGSIAAVVVGKQFVQRRLLRRNRRGRSIAGVQRFCEGLGGHSSLLGGRNAVRSFQRSCEAHGSGLAGLEFL